MSPLAKSTSLASGTGESTALAVLVDRVDDPVDARIVADLLVVWVNHDHFVVLHGGVLVDPIGVQNTQVAVPASCFLFGNGLKVTLELELVDTLMLGLTEHHTTVVLALASSATDSGTDNNEALLGLVSETVSLLWTRGTVASQDIGTLTVFPSTDTHQESEGIRLLVAPKLFHILVSTHGSSFVFGCNSRGEQDVRLNSCTSVAAFWVNDLLLFESVISKQANQVEIMVLLTFSTRKFCGCWCERPCVPTTQRWSDTDTGGLGPGAGSSAVHGQLA